MRVMASNYEAGHISPDEVDEVFHWTEDSMKGLGSAKGWLIRPLLRFSDRKGTIP